MAIPKDVFKETYSKYVSREVWNEECNNLRDGESKILYFDRKEKVRVRISKVGKKIFTVKTSFGDMDIRECVRNMIIKQV